MNLNPMEKIPDENAAAPAAETSEPVQALDQQSPASAPEPQAQDQPQQEAQVEPQQLASKDDVIPVVGQVPPEQDAAEMTAQHMALGDDLNQGRIKPETYNSLFESKSTLGKLGTLFGLMVSGAGSGLAGQSNSLLDMMNKTIQNDLDAQRENQKNKLNWYHAGIDYARSKADVNRTNAETSGIKTENISKGTKAATDIFGNVAAGIPELEGTSFAKSGMMLTFVQQEQDRINRLAPGVAKQVAQNKLDTIVKPQIYNDIYRNNLIIAQKKHLLNTINNPTPIKKEQQVDPRDTGINQQNLNSKLNLGRLLSATPEKVVAAGGIPVTDEPIVKSEQAGLSKNRNNYADFLYIFDRLAQLKNAGQIPYMRTIGSVASSIGTGLGSILGGAAGSIGGSVAGNAASHGLGDLKDQYERERNVFVKTLRQRMAKGESDETQNEIIDSMLPSWLDSPKSREDAYKMGVQHFKSLENDVSTLKRYNLYKPIKDVPYVPSKFDKEDKAKEIEGKNEAKSMRDAIRQQTGFGGKNK